MKNTIDLITFKSYMNIIDDLFELKPCKYMHYDNTIIVSYHTSTPNKKDIASEIDFLQAEKNFVCKSYTGYQITLNDGFLTIIIELIG